MQNSSLTDAVPLTLAGRTALITGGSRGIGAATVRLFRQAGARVAFSYRNARDEAKSLAHQLGGAPNCIPIQHALESAEDGASLVAQTIKALGDLDILVANHGIWPPDETPVARMTAAQFRRTQAVNVESVFGLCHAAAAHMLTHPAPTRIITNAPHPAEQSAGGPFMRDRKDAHEWETDAANPAFASQDAPGAPRMEKKAGAPGREKKAGAPGREKKAGAPGMEKKAGAPGASPLGTWEGAPQKLARGHIVLVASAAGQRGEGLHADYAASKGAIISFTKSLSSELAPHLIYANCVAPGWTHTQMTASVFDDPAVAARTNPTIPLGRPAHPYEVAGPILFLCTPLAGFISGEILNANGGAVLAG
jgi:NAD(P)-dependent dehydrogenase (short-subunit alcohol dehydrogenase family)